MVQAHIFFSGTVQGVGFRYTAQNIASRLRVCGWVKNLSDGRVEIMAQASQEEIGEFCAELEKEFQGHIRDKTVEFLKSDGALGFFRVLR